MSKACWKCGGPTPCEHGEDPARIIAEGIASGVIPAVPKKPASARFVTGDDILQVYVRIGELPDPLSKPWCETFADVLNQIIEERE